MMVKYSQLETGQTRSRHHIITCLYKNYWLISIFCTCKTFAPTALSLNDIFDSFWCDVWRQAPGASPSSCVQHSCYTLNYSISISTTSTNHNNLTLKSTFTLFVTQIANWTGSNSNCKFINICCSRFDTILRSILYSVKFWWPLARIERQNLIFPKIKPANLFSFKKI